MDIQGATSEEFSRDKTTPNVIEFVEGQEAIRQKSGTMRLGAYDCELKKDSLIRELYGKKTISERHRHRYEVASKYTEQFESNNFVVSGRNPQTGLVEMMELDRKVHPYFVGTQAHPEFRSRLHEPAALFNGLVAAALAHKQKASNG